MRRFLWVLLLIIALFFATASMAQAQYPPGAVADIQGKLIQRGYHPGGVDGVWGRKTIGALRRYQLDHGLPATGRLNPPTARSLGIPLPGEAEVRPPGPPMVPDGPPRPPVVPDGPPRPPY